MTTAADEEPLLLALTPRTARLLERGFKLGLLAESRTTGAEPSAASSALLARLHQATQGRSSVPGTPTPAPATVDHEGFEGSLMGMRDAAAVLGCTAEYARRLARTGRLRAHRVGGVWAVRPEDLDAYRYGRTEDTSGQSGPAPRGEPAGPAPRSHDRGDGTQPL
ncbi:helix-turn-helix domain-containing protein [Streptomyces sp. NPDC057148]|uniref:helix-turn-helix domain-containing protein n=1 Tax=unclassified Streptomyces TaxID=2593676 RepID=UPI0036299854